MDGDKKKAIQCNQCKRMSCIADTFVFNGKTYCNRCLFSLIFDMAETGNINLDMDDCESKGIIVSF